MLRSTVFVLLLAAPAIAQEANDLCGISSGIAGSAVTERTAGLPADEAISVITASLGDDRASYVAAVQPIVEWVYTLPEDQLTDEVAASYEAACRAQ